MILSLGRSDGPSAPWEIREEVELYAREHGRTGSIELVQAPGFQCWVVKLSLKPNDERMRLSQQGLVSEPVPEMVWITDPTGAALDIYQMGPSGVRKYLERGNTWSGRGEFSSVTEAVQKAKEIDAENVVRYREQMKEENRYERRDKRSQYMNVPTTTVGIDLKQKSES